MEIRERNLTRILEELVRTEDRLAHAKAALVEELGFVRKWARDISTFDVVYTGQEYEYLTVGKVETRVPPEAGEEVVVVDFYDGDADVLGGKPSLTKHYFADEFVDVKMPVPEVAF